MMKMGVFEIYLNKSDIEKLVKTEIRELSLWSWKYPLFGRKFFNDDN